MGFLVDTQKEGGGHSWGCLRSLVRRKHVDSANGRSQHHQLAKALTVSHLVAIGKLLLYSGFLMPTVFSTLLSAVAAGSVASLELLVKAGAKANVFAGVVTLLHIATDIGDFELINCLLKAGADPNQKDEVKHLFSDETFSFVPLDPI
ncbi:unnamed protein product [Eruca vesicaria subsp. sativa]|uniref:Ankyrin repeat protein n=1 Tax=Eruca vesicaria subsp. sativa TaxID=29727 RepID=A0ABC8JUE7_ERUVS|nr:unnamed protein product [Eruca vesicaria subsp. sativa]